MLILQTPHMSLKITSVIFHSYKKGFASIEGKTPSGKTIFISIRGNEISAIILGNSQDFQVSAILVK